MGVQKMAVDYSGFKTCPICKKRFLPAPYHAWTIRDRDGEKLVCSYTCMRNHELTKGPKRIYARKKDEK